VVSTVVLLSPPSFNVLRLTPHINHHTVENNRVRITFLVLADFIPLNDE
jgi:hypothetical protein